MLGLQSDDKTVFWPNNSFAFIFDDKFSNSIISWTTFINEVFDLESDKMTALWPNNNQNISFHAPFSISIPDWIRFAKEAFWFDA